MKILQIVADGKVGGGTTFVLDLMQDTPGCTLITQSNSYAQKQTDGIGLDFFTSRFDPRIPYHLYQTIKKQGPDLIHVHGGRAAFFLSFCPKVCPIIYTCHGLHGIYQKSLLGEWGQKWAMRRSDLVTFVSHSEETLAIKLNLMGRTPHCVIPNGVNLNKLPKRKKPKPKLLGFIGRLVYQKDPLFLLKVMDLLGPQGYHLKVVGGGPYEKEMQTHPNVTLLGTLPQKEALASLTDVEALLMPSRWEALPLVMLEAMGMEIPIIASHIPPFEEVLKHGTLIKERDPQLYANAVLNLNDQSTKAKKDLIENYSWEKCRNAYHAIFREFNRNS